MSVEFQVAFLAHSRHESLPKEKNYSTYFQYNKYYFKFNNYYYSYTFQRLWLSEPKVDTCS